MIAAMVSHAGLHFGLRKDANEISAIKRALEEKIKGL